MNGDEREEASAEELEQAVEAAEPVATPAATGGEETVAAVDEVGADTEVAPPPPTATPDDADDLRGYHFRLLLHKPLTWILVGGGSLVLGVIGALAFSPLIGAIAFVVAFLIALWLTFNVADSRAADDFFNAYARQRDLVVGGKTSLPPVTPLLRKGDAQYAERTLTGELAPGVGGMLAIYTYVTESTDSNGNTEKTYHPFTLGMTEVPECVSHLPELYCQRKSGLRALEKFEDVFRRSKQRVKLESEVLDEKYEIFAGKSQDANWLRQLFAPTFIVWLTDSAPKKFAFELVAGNLCCYVSGHKKRAEELDEIGLATATVAKRLREEALE
jgi:hypothetical protein